MFVDSHVHIVSSLLHSIYEDKAITPSYQVGGAICTSRKVAQDYRILFK